MRVLKITVKTLLYVCTALLFIACSNNQVSIVNVSDIPEQKNTKSAKKISEIKDLKTLSQNPANYTKNIPLLNSKMQKVLDQKFNNLYFSPWDLKKTSSPVEKAMWGNMYAKRKMYAANHKVIPKAWFDKQIENSNLRK